MTIDKIKKAREAVPFRPFTIHLADGRLHRVPHRDYLAMHPEGGRIVTVYQPGARDASSDVDAILITELAFEDAPSPTTGGNGPAQ